jgi:ATPase subunit of ABC transporter with duplicated ATPase domains
MEKTFLTVNNLSKTFKTRKVVKDVSLSVQNGEVVGLLGPNGAGKTTTVRMLTSILAPTSGWARIAGYDVAEYPEQVRGQVGAMPDEELAAAAGAPVELARALRGARTIVEAKEIAAQIVTPRQISLGEEARPTLARFAELRVAAPEHLDEPAARSIVRELKAVGGNLKALRLALTGAERGPELWTVVAALDRDEALRRTVAL